MAEPIPTSPAPAVPYRERLLPRWWMWVLALAFALSIGLSYSAPFGAGFGWVAALLSGGLVTLGLFAWSPTIEVRDGHLTAGRARIDVVWLCAVTPLDAQAATRLRGRDADPSAWMLLRGWIGTAVRVDLDDPDDPTPYWYLSTRNPDALTSAIERERFIRGYGRMTA